jgi:hypothetical protein
MQMTCRRSAHRWQLLQIPGLLLLSLPLITSASLAAQPAPTVASGYKLTTFAASPAGSSAPDSIALVKDAIWVAYGNGGKADGSEGAKSTIVEYSSQGQVLRSLTVVGHNDGLRLDPHTNKLWAMQNEDSNPNLVLIDPASGAMDIYKFGSTPHGGGYDDIAFVGDEIYLSASNPTADAKGNVAGPSVVRVFLNSDHTVSVTPALAGGPNATDITTGKGTTLNPTDPDSLIPMPGGGLLLDDQGDAQLLEVHLFSAQQPVVRVLPLAGGVQVDDTVFATTPHGYLLVADRDANTVYKLETSKWPSGAAFSASTGVAASTKPPITPAIPAYVGQLDLKSGALAPIVSNMASPHGMAFVESK